MRPCRYRPCSGPKEWCRKPPCGDQPHAALHLRKKDSVISPTAATSVIRPAAFAGGGRLRQSSRRGCASWKT